MYDEFVKTELTDLEREGKLPKITIRIGEESHEKLRKIAMAEGLSYGKAFEKIIERGKIFNQKELLEVTKTAIHESFTEHNVWKKREGQTTLDGIFRIYGLMCEISKKIDPAGHDERVSYSDKWSRKFMAILNEPKK